VGEIAFEWTIRSIITARLPSESQIIMY
jgi:hypothetical protein